MQPLNFKTMNCKECNKELIKGNYNPQYGNWCNDCKNAYQRKYRKENGYIYDQAKYKEKHKAKKKGVEEKPSQRDKFIMINGIEIF